VATMTMAMADAQIQACLQKSRSKYMESAKKDITTALRNFPDLSADCEMFSFPNGLKQMAFRLKGTIPVMYKGVSYNIPIALYLWDTHPYYAPLCFVCPTAEMVVKDSPTVDKSGKVYLPYLNEWRFPDYDLNGLLQVMAISFQESCPVFAKPGGQSQTFTPYPTTTPTAMPTPFSPFSSPSPTPYPSYSTPQPQPQQQQQQQQHVQGSSTISADHIRASLLSAVQDRIRHRLSEKVGTVHAELASIRQTQQELRTGHDKLKRMLEELESEQRVIDTASLLYQEKKLELERILSSSKTGDNLDVDGAIDAPSPLHRQLLAAYVADCAVDDAVYFLGQALKKNVVSLSDYLNHVRQLSRRQFIYRATMQKCRIKSRLPV